MPVLVEPDPTQVEALLKAMPAGSHAVASADRMQAWLDQHHDEYVVVLGPSPTLEEVETVCSRLRVAHPTVSVLLVRESLSTETLARAMKSGARDVVAANDPDAVVEAVERARQLFVALRGPSGAAQQGRVVTVFSPKGGVGKTTVAVNLALALTDKGARKVCLVDLDLGFGDVAITMQVFPTHSIEQAVGLGEHHRPAHARGTAHPAPGLPDAARRPVPSRRARASHPGAGLQDPAHPARGVRLRRGRHRPVVRRPDADRSGRDRRVRDRGDARRTHAEERQGRSGDARGARHRPRSPAPAAEPCGRRGRHQHRQGRVDPGHGDRRPGRRPPSRSRPPPTPAPRSSPRSRSTSPAPRSSSSPRRSSARRWPLLAAPPTNGTAHASQPRAGRFRRKREVHA